MNKRLLGAAAAAGLAVLGTFAILLYVRDADDRAKADVELVEVFVIEEPVSAGTGDPDLRNAIGTAEIQANTVVAGVITDLNQLNGQVAAVDLIPGEQVLLSRFTDAEAFNDERDQLIDVPANLHEVTVSLEPQRLVGGKVEPGDTVGVLGSFTPSAVTGVPLDNIDSAEEFDRAVSALTELSDDVEYVATTHFVLDKVLVTRVQRDQLPAERTDANGNPVDTSELAPTGSLLVTLAVDAESAQKLVFTAEFGLIWMTYQPLTTPDTSADLEATNRSNVFELADDDERFDPFGSAATDGDEAVAADSTDGATGTDS